MAAHKAGHSVLSVCRSTRIVTVRWLNLTSLIALQVHKMLVDTAFALIDGGEKGIFTPMHMLVFQKPE